MYTFGWRSEEEDHDQLVRTQVFFDHKLFGTATPPASLDPRPHLHIKNQGKISGCTGWSGSTDGEGLNWIKTGGDTIQFSEMHHYLTAQKRSNCFGTDRGATISGSVEAMLRDGFALQKDMPDVGQYVTDIPSVAIQDGLKHLVKTHTVLETYDAAFQYLATGTGMIQIGIPVGQGFMDCTGRLTRNDMRSKPVGGHALAIVGYVLEVDEQGRHWPILINSWGKKWGDNGTCIVEPELFDLICKSQQCEVIGVSDLEAYEDAAGRLDFTGAHF